ncbi:hypothetical protein RHMOL_Rhmol04G0004500 [Rhododendron molle]|uniref:Uncharacterized protein n=1 Tax=Rhododendron molle TaxID=49168 RepID=A0ACC0NWH5_RHOML|nr:hypothetical protein RHMOL_Rhmol04G0004500 [Rhododendron molle]
MISDRVNFWYICSTRRALRSERFLSLERDRRGGDLPCTTRCAIRGSTPCD